MSTQGLFESLETRKFLTATLDPVTHVLTVTGGPGATNDKIDISISPPPAPGTPPSPPRIIVKDLVAHTITEFRANAVVKIVVRTGDGNDEVSVGPGVLRPEQATVIDLGSGDDKAHVANGRDEIFGGTGNDSLYGGRGPDFLSGGDGNDLLVGGDGDDVMRGGAGADVFNGGGGFDLVDYANATSNLKVSIDGLANDGAAGEGDYVQSSVENIRGGSGNDSLTGSAAPNRIDGGAGNDTIRGYAGPDGLNGGAGNDSIDGGGGNDRIDGGADNDTLTGGAGRDLLYGGPGDDVFNTSDGEIDTLFGGSGIDSKTSDATDVLHDIP